MNIYFLHFVTFSINIFEIICVANRLNIKILIVFTNLLTFLVITA